MPSLTTKSTARRYSHYTPAAVLLLALAILPTTQSPAFIINGNCANTIDVFPDRPGDPLGLTGSPTIITASLGLNQAKEGFSCLGGGCTDHFDSFRMRIPPGLEVVTHEFSVLHPNGMPEQLYIIPTDGTTIIDPHFATGWRQSAIIDLTANINNSPLQNFTVLGPGLYDVILAPIGDACWQYRFFTLEIPPCIPDLTTTNTNPGDPGYGIADGAVNGADLSFYVEQWLGSNAAVADLTTTNTNPGDPNYGIPDTLVNGADLSFYVEAWLAGCP